MAKSIPVIGDWYQDAVEDTLFEVVAVDTRSATIEVQYVDGEVGEFDIETWMQMILLSAKPPEDWRVSYELDANETSDPDAAYHPGNLDDPLREIEPDSMYGMEEF